MSAHAIMRGSSMRPLLQDGMLLEVAPPRRFSRGQIAVFKAGERLVAHRILCARDATVVCCGDAQPDRLDIVDAADVLGVVSAVYRSDGVRVRRIDSILFRSRGLALAYLQPFRAFFERAAPHRRERTYRSLVQAAGAILRDDAIALLHAVEQAAPLRFAAMATRHGMGDAVRAALEPLRENPYADAVCELLARSRPAAACERGISPEYPPLRHVFLFAKTGAVMLAECSARVPRSRAALLLLASQLAGAPRPADRRTRRLAEWMQQREDLPEPLRVRSQCVDAWFAADRRVPAFIAAAVQARSLRGALERLASAAAIALYVPFMR